jgi:hypothetical protein
MTYHEDILNILIPLVGRDYGDIVRDINKLKDRTDIKHGNIAPSVDTLIIKGIIEKDNTGGKNKTILKFLWTRDSLHQVISNYKIDISILHSDEKGVNAAIEVFKDFDNSSRGFVYSLVKSYPDLFKALLVDDVETLQSKCSAISVLCHVMENHQKGLEDLCLVYQLFSSLSVKKDAEYDNYREKLKQHIRILYIRGQQHKSLDRNAREMGEYVKRVKQNMENPHYVSENNVISDDLRIEMTQLVSDFCNTYKSYFNNPEDTSLIQFLSMKFDGIHKLNTAPYDRHRHNSINIF